MPTMMRALRAAPYLVVLAVAGALLHVATWIEYRPQPRRLGPDVWPMLILCFVMAVAAYGALRALLSTKQERGLSLARLAGRTEESEAREPAGSSWGRMLAGLAVMAGFTASLGSLGFPLATVLLLFALMLVGGFRRPVAAATIASAGTLALVFIFQKVAYVSLPLGTEPFVQVTYALMALMGIR